MAMHQPTATSPLFPVTRERVTLLLLVTLSLVSTTIAIVAFQRPPTVLTVPAPAPAVSAPAPSVPVAPGMDRQAALIDAYERLNVQLLAAAQAVRAGSIENYEIAVSGAEALRSRIADLQAQRQAALDLDRAIIETHEQMQLQRLAAEQALRAGNTENYEIAVSGAEALQSRIASLQAQRAER